MRLVSLDLTRYGKFTDRRIDFGPARPGKPDLHVIYGPNEAGKSTVLSAYLDLLFGMDRRSRYNFLHPYPAMQIGGRLDFDGGSRDLQRVKRDQNSLLDGKGGALDERLVLAELAGIDREAYRTMFSLDDETLEQGGETILASKGDLGQLLFSASAGLSGFAEALGAISGTAESFYRKGARSGELVTLKAKLQDLKQRREALDTIASAYRQLVDGRAEAAGHYEAALAEHGRSRARAAEIGRLLGALPQLAERRRLRDALATLGDLPAAPPGWKEEVPRLHTDTTKAAAVIEEIRRDVAELTAELGAGDLDEAALGIAARFADLGDLEMRHRSADSDLPNRRRQARDFDIRIEGVLQSLGRADEREPGRLLLGAAAVGSFRSLIETFSGVEAGLERAKAERDLAQDRCDAVARRLSAASGTPDTPGPMPPAAALRLSTALGVVKAGDPSTLRKVAERELSKTSAIVDDRTAALAPWRGGLAALEALALPAPGDIARWRDALEKGARRLEKQDEAIEAARGRITDAEAEGASLAAELGLAGEEGIAAVRAARKAAWLRHRAELQASTAEAFETALDREEAVTDASLAQASLAARLREAERARARARADLGEAERRRADALDHRREIAAEVDAALGPLRADHPGATLAFAEAFLPKRQALLDALAARRRAEGEVAEARAAGETLRESLLTALVEAGVAVDPTSGFDALVMAAEARKALDATLAALTEEAETAARDLARREDELDRASTAMKTWEEAWHTACSSSWLADGDFLPSMGAVREVLASLQTLATLLGERAGLAERIVKMEDDRVAFSEAVCAIAQEIGEPVAGEAIGLATRLRARIAAAEFETKRRAGLEERLHGAEKRLREAEALRAALLARASEITGYFGTETLGDAAVALDKAERRAELSMRSQEAELRLMDAARAETPEAAEAALDGLDRAALEAESGELTARIEGEENRLRDLHTQVARAEDRIEAIGGDDAIARIDVERRTLLLEIEDGAMRSLRLRAGALAAARALSLYRDRHRSAMMRRASEAFRAITAGAYLGLATQPDKDGDVIVALAADGGSRLPAELSKGTCFQLYLSLRLAGYGEFAAVRPSVPFIADDIMETFDDGRAEETFRLFGDMALVGQVIYLTHHRHLCEMARRVCPDMVLHHLDGQAAERPAA